jgi:hypothetical protein
MSLQKEEFKKAFVRFRKFCIFANCNSYDVISDDGVNDDFELLSSIKTLGWPTKRCDTCSLIPKMIKLVLKVKFWANFANFIPLMTSNGKFDKHEKHALFFFLFFDRFPNFFFRICVFMIFAYFLNPFTGDFDLPKRKC